MRPIHSILLMGVLAACGEIPDSGAGAYFDSSAEARQARELQLSGQGAANIVQPGALSDEARPVTIVPAASTVTAAPLGDPMPMASAQDSSADLAAEAAAALAASSANSGVAPVNASPSNPAPVTLNNPGISDENDFAAVSNRQTIESDAERIARNREQYQVIQPTALPSRSGSGGPNIVTYALETKHARGTRLYSRSGINLAARAQRACAGYPSADQAQIAFLAKGGPERDRLGLDPDGDGYACSWNPAPFRAAVNN
ncbi:hypothetical protein ACXYMO_06415 [Arenibacterium sp. CAU 1754]